MDVNAHECVSVFVVWVHVCLQEANKNKVVEHTVLHSSLHVCVVVFQSVQQQHR